MKNIDDLSIKKNARGKYANNMMTEREDVRKEARKNIFKI